MIIISVTVHIVHVYLIALLIITIAVFVAPIFVPMCLFETTKRMFESWVKAIFGYVIQPVVLFIFLGFMYTMMDMVMFGKCKIVVNDNWRSSTQNTILTSLGVDKSKIKVWSITDKGAEDVEGCVNSYGFLIQNIFDFGFAGSSFGFGDINIHNVLENCIIVFVFAVIFYFFARLADSIAADISQSIGMSDMAMQATHLADKAFETMVKGAMLATSAAGKVFQLAGSPVNPADVVKRGVNKAMQKGREAKNKLENTKQNVSKVVNTVKDKLNKKPNE
jgi:type IV secretion system protein VirB6